MLGREQAYAIVSRGNPIAGENEIGWDRLLGETLLFSTRDAGPEAENALIAKLGGPGRWPNLRLHTVNRDTLQTLVAIGRGVAIMIASDLGHLPSEAVAVPLVDVHGRTREMLTAYRDPGNDNPPLRRFCSMLKSLYAEVG